jgi:hypothetical protein
MDLNTFIVVLTIVILLFVLVFTCDKPENFDPNMITGGDFHIQPPGAIADSGSFTNDMMSYMQGQGPI